MVYARHVRRAAAFLIALFVSNPIQILIRHEIVSKKTVAKGGGRMFNLGVQELVLILIIALVVFGPGKLPEVGKSIGRSIREFKSASQCDQNSNKI